jgi:hypothetical protein
MMILPICCAGMTARLFRLKPWLIDRFACGALRIGRMNRIKSDKRNCGKTPYLI